mmetsp:Transcript_47385/g.152662  ORF Transcript_47385/g.152662 Transcript_47385/m.152662 type:complete len:203 (+) Transcript_47385:151-759(+)
MPSFRRSPSAGHTVRRCAVASAPPTFTQIRRALRGWLTPLAQAGAACNPSAPATLIRTTWPDKATKLPRAGEAPVILASCPAAAIAAAAAIATGAGTTTIIGPSTGAANMCLGALPLVLFILHRQGVSRTSVLTLPLLAARRRSPQPPLLPRPGAPPASRLRASSSAANACVWITPSHTDRNDPGRRRRRGRGRGRGRPRLG